MTHRQSVIRPEGGEEIVLPAPEGGDIRKAMFDAVLDVVKGGDSFICELDTAIQQTKVIESIHQQYHRLPVLVLHLEVLFDIHEAYQKPYQ